MFEMEPRMKHGWNTEKEGGEDGAQQELRPTGPTDGAYSEGRVPRVPVPAIHPCFIRGRKFREGVVPNGPFPFRILTGSAGAATYEHETGSAEVRRMHVGGDGRHAGRGSALGQYLAAPRGALGAANDCRCASWHPAGPGQAQAGAMVG